MFNQMILHLLLLLSGVLSNGLVENSGIHGRVTNSFEYPLANVFVWANLEPISWEEYGVTQIGETKHITMTNSEGYYTINLPPGYYEVYASDDSIAFGSGSLVKVEDELFEYNLVNDRIPIEDGSVKGLVLDDLGLPVSRATVSCITQISGHSSTAQDGIFTLPWLTPGLHLIGVQKLNFSSSVSDTIWIKPGEVTVCNFTDITGKCLVETTGRITGTVETIPEIEYQIFVGIVGGHSGSLVDSNGQYQIRFLDEGDYTLIANCVGFQPRHSSLVHVSEGSTAIFDFTTTNPNPESPNGYALEPEAACGLGMYGSGLRMRGRRK